MWESVRMSRLCTLQSSQWKLPTANGSTIHPPSMERANTRHTGLSAGPSDKLKGRISNLRSPADAMHASGCSLEAACSQVVIVLGTYFFGGGIKAVYWTSILTHNLGWEHVKARLVTVQYLASPVHLSQPTGCDRLPETTVVAAWAPKCDCPLERRPWHLRVVKMHVPWQAKRHGTSLSGGRANHPLVDWSQIIPGLCKFKEQNSIHNWNHQAMFDYTERFASLCYIV